MVWSSRTRHSTARRSRLSRSGCPVLLPPGSGRRRCSPREITARATACTRDADCPLPSAYATLARPRRAIRVRPADQRSVSAATDRPIRCGRASLGPARHNWRRVSAQGAPSLPADRRLPGAIAANCGAVGPGAALVSHPQRSPETLSEGPSPRPAAAPCSGLKSRHGCEEHKIIRRSKTNCRI